jgi:hypothetical protein
MRSKAWVCGRSSAHRVKMMHYIIKVNRFPTHRVTIMHYIIKVTMFRIHRVTMMYIIITVNRLLTNPVTLMHNITTANKLLTHRVTILHNIMTLKIFLTHRVALTHAQSFNKTAVVLLGQPICKHRKSAGILSSSVKLCRELANELFAYQTLLTYKHGQIYFSLSRTKIVNTYPANVENKVSS